MKIVIDNSIPSFGNTWVIYPFLKPDEQVMWSPDIRIHTKELDDETGCPVDCIAISQNIVFGSKQSVDELREFAHVLTVVADIADNLKVGVLVDLQYRMLRAGEVIQADDEFLDSSADEPEWGLVEQSVVVGYHLTKTDVGSFRRKLI